MPGQLFITGYLRSGTTLLEKLLHNHEAVCVAPQPFPFLFYRAKEAFYRERGIAFEGYPLGHLFRERSYSTRDLTSFLMTHIFEAEEVAGAFRDMEGYSGQYVPELQRFRDSFHGGTFLDIYRRLTDLVAGIYRKEGALYKGSKEVFCEEFAPFFLESGAKVVVIIRDPRDVLTSANFGKGEKYIGKGLPTLYNLRKWRKSVAFALAYKGDAGFRFVRYEDLVRDTWVALDELTDFLGVEPFSKDQFDKGILDQKGELWMSNSSFEASGVVSRGSLGSFRKRLSEDTIRYIESVCYPEMRALGYEFHSCKDGFDEAAVRSFREPFEVGGKVFPADYSIQPFRAEEEIKRFRLIGSKMSEDEAREWFIFPKAHDLLKKALND